MSHRCLTPVVVALAVASTLPLAAQPQRITANAKSSAVARTSDGHPDMQGIWTNATITPMEPPIFASGWGTPLAIGKEIHW